MQGPRALGEEGRTGLVVGGLCVWCTPGRCDEEREGGGPLQCAQGHFPGAGGLALVDSKKLWSARGWAAVFGQMVSSCLSCPVTSVGAVGG